MPALTQVQLRPPYLVMIGDMGDPTYAKTGLGLVQWAAEHVMGQLRFDRDAVDLGVPDRTVEEAVNLGAGSLVIGVAPAGGQVPERWWSVIEQASRAGLDIVNGLHVRLADNPRLVAASAESGARLVDVRVPPRDIPVASGRKRTGRRLLTVGTDCAVGKKYTALALTRALRSAGIEATFRATGQTGIMLAGSGIPIDAVVSDFLAGAAELLSPDNDPGHWDVIEGQGSLFHPAYSAVSLGLLHGSQPDAFVVCHDPGRTRLSGWEHFSLPTVRECIERHRELGCRTNPAIRCVGLSVNTSSLPEEERQAFLSDLGRDTGLPCVDPLRDGCAAIVAEMDALEGGRSP